MSEPIPGGQGGIYLGKTLVYGLPFYLDCNSLMNPHIAIIGMSGSGKSYLLKSVVAKSVINQGAKLLAIDWNDEYSELIGFLSGKVLNFGKDFRINVMDTYSGSLGGASNLVELIDTMLGLEQTQRSLLHGVILELFGEEGPKNLGSLISKVKAQEPILAGRLSQLSGNPFFAGHTEFNIGKILDGVYSINLSTLRDSAQRAELVRFVLRLVIDCMHKTEIQEGKRRILVLDESWRLLKNSDEVGTLYREGRKYGISVVSATQMASDINNEIVANSGCLAVFRLQSEQDYSILENIGLIGQDSKTIIGSLGIGSCMLSLAYKGNTGGSSSFYIKKISGIEFGRLKMMCGTMKYEISYQRFLAVTELLCDMHLKDKIASFALQNQKSIDVESFIRFLGETGLPRADIVFYLRELGIDDLAIVNAYEKA
jgi:ABC-type dipeptide/oligopeptide/nickel transport system ATPase component